MKKRSWTIGIATLVIGVATPPGPLSAQDGQGPPPVESLGNEGPIEEIEVPGRRPVTATSTMTIPADSFDLRPLESGGQMLEAVPNLITAQHTGGGKAEQYFIRGFDADHGTDLAVYFDGVPINLRSHAHGQGFSDLKPQGSWFAYGKDAPVPFGVWSSLRVLVHCNTFSVSLNGEHLFDVEDDTFAQAGKVGLWTKADSVTLFDTLTARSL